MRKHSIEFKGAITPIPKEQAVALGIPKRLVSAIARRARVKSGRPEGRR